MATARDTASPPRTHRFLDQSGPVEIILNILQSCHSIRDLNAFASTCQRVCHIWRGNVAAVLWPVLLHEIPHFQDAVIAVRTPLSDSRNSGADMGTNHDRPA